MLNRRNLRIKVMQSLFALQQNREADYEICLDYISDRFQPDLNSMEVQNKELLKQKKAKATQLFEDAFKRNETTVSDDDPAIEKAVNDCFSLHQKQIKKDTDFFRKNMVTEVERIYDHYVSVLQLVVEFAEVAATDKKVNHGNLLSNAWIRALQTSETLKKDYGLTKQPWQSEHTRVKSWFRDIVRQDTEYQAYLDKKNPSSDDEKKFINHLFKKVILGKTIINEYFEEAVLRWSEDKDIVKGLVEKTVKSYNPEEEKPLRLHTLSVNWDEDLEFIERLYSATLDLEDKYKNLIAQNTRNWEVDRLPLTDRVILEMAIAELLSFPNIPVKVTINEYIELAKNYSTPKSRQFINGMLDVIAKELQEEGALRKSGRGLIDNK